ncbi:translation initiation factor IF-2 N-terminal domain-containing protein [Goodfellowiella coeruleoviolacea]|uniref:Ribonuclease E n=1 Tax=Goodfellowiella coeruleoviolacea TaxID=334858 RepID=A0AAE3GB89_9PSEU|nr:translation initiation factor IF-2 N-terminal domain-containing protein [Goodfellowiella coeruleoviolacea]MCP2165116.1 ribonuclease E [Goodfellowiella coeruleoviolacea]
MSDTDTPAGTTGGDWATPGIAELVDLPPKLRVHALAKLLGVSSREVLSVLADLGESVRSAQSSVNRETALKVADALLPEQGTPGQDAPEQDSPEQDDTVQDNTGGSAAEAADQAGVVDQDESTTHRAEPPAAVAPTPAPEPPVGLAPVFAPPSPLFLPPQPVEQREEQPPARAAARPATRTSAPPPAVTDHVEPDEVDQAEEDSAEVDGQFGEETETGARRRRRRGRRGRGRGKGAGGDDDIEQSLEDREAEPEPEETAEAEEEPAEDTAEDVTEGATSRRRRRRRRRKGGADDEAALSEDDPPNTVVHVRDVRDDKADSAAAQDEVRGVRGSTRLEAKRQRRRDGREAGRRRVPVLSEAEFLARRESVERTMVVRERGDRTQIGVLEDGVLVEHFVTSTGTGSLVGNVYLGRVQNVLPSMEAAFVDIGRGRNAVLYAGEVDWDAAGLEGKARKIEQALSTGDSVLVQVTKDPVGHKGARLTTQISLPGRFLVYVPGGGATGISRKLPDIERKRLKDILKRVVPDDAGVIIRTASEGISEEELGRDVRRLQAQWEVIKEKADQPRAQAPQLLYEEPDLLIKVVRDLFTEDFSALVVQGDSAWDTIDAYVRHVAPDLVGRLRRHVGNTDVFTEHRIDEQLLKALDRKVWLPSGGYLVIDRTEAMTVIDVNTGKFTGSGGNLEETVTRNNLEAAEEIVRQLRLRDVGGIIVIDFIDMVLEANRDLVLRRLTECLGRDRTRHQVAEVTSLGLVQMTRKRVGTGLLEAFSTTCEHCRGRGVLVSTEPVGAHNGAGQQNGGQQQQGGRKAKQRARASEHAEPAPEPAQQPAAKAEPAQTGPAQTGPAQTGPAQTGPAQTGPAHAEQPQAEPAKAEPVAAAAGTDTGRPAAAQSGAVVPEQVTPAAEQAPPPAAQERVTEQPAPAEEPAASLAEAPAEVRADQAPPVTHRRRHVRRSESRHADQRSGAGQHRAEANGVAEHRPVERTPEQRVEPPREAPRPEQVHPEPVTPEPAAADRLATSGQPADGSGSAESTGQSAQPRRENGRQRRVARRAAGRPSVQAAPVEPVTVPAPTEPRQVNGHTANAGQTGQAGQAGPTEQQDTRREQAEPVVITRRRAVRRAASRPAGPPVGTV